MNRYLIYRTDRIGDFLLSCILIKSIKRNDPDSHITLIASKKNYEYIKTFNLVDNVILLNNTLLGRLSIIKELRKSHYNFSILHDGKNRSKFINFFLKKQKSFFFNNSDISISHIEKIKNVLSCLNFNIIEEDLNLFSSKTYNINSTLKFKNYLIVHYDEKWSIKNYISNYKNIEPNEEEFIDFLKKIIFKCKINIIITTGKKTPKLITNIFKNNTFKNIMLIENQNFDQLESIVSQSKILISCHGSISHVTAAFKIKQIDIIDDNKLNPYFNWSKHFRNYKYVYRNNFKTLSEEILNLL